MYINKDEESSFVSIKVILPICLHLDNRVFDIPYRNLSIYITTNNIQSEEPTYLGQVKNMEVISDSFSHYRFSEIEVIIPAFEANIDLSDILEKYRKPFFMAINRFIDAARISLSRYGLRNYYDYHEFYKSVIVSASWDDEHCIEYNIMPGEGLSTLKPTRNNEEHNRIQAILLNSLQLYEVFLEDSKKDLSNNNYLHSLLNAIVALEVRVSETINEIGIRKGLTLEDLKGFIKDVGLTGNISKMLKLLSTDNLEMPSDKVFSSCKGAITLRNKIMHEGKRDITSKEAENALNSVKPIIDYCNNLLESITSA